MTEPANSSSRGRLWTTVRYGMGGLILLALGGTTFISLKSVQALSSEVSQLKAAFQESPDIAPFQAQLTAMQQRFDALQTQQNVMAEKSALATLQQQVGTLDRQLHEQATLVAKMSTELSSLQNQLHILNQRPVNIQATTPAVTTVKKKSTAKAPQHIAAPFILTGIERRGGIAFAAIAPKSATQLAEISLMEPGETRQGWTLQAIAGQQVQFRVAGQTRTLTLR